MKYMLMIFDREDAWEHATEEEIAATMEAHGAFGAYLQGRGGEYSGEALHPARTASTLHPKPDGEGVAITDGPFVELKEHLGGYYIIEAADLDDAIEVGKRCPAKFGLEIRPVVDFSP